MGNAQREFIDPATPAAACTKAVCVGSYAQCCGSNPNSCVSTGSTENLVSSGVVSQVLEVVMLLVASRTLCSL